MVLTDEQETDQYPAATMEVGDSSLENLYYTNLDETRVRCRRAIQRIQQSIPTNTSPSFTVPIIIR